ncbi:major fimbrial subunit protein FimA [Dysgonomonas alginatilytica]|uniref:Major fimbrial subunit protein FimA n=1 Tax=Dysgonomonas alginatilytica TaxID=1605892 RepID=A0A2V3PRZ9_9BACT|nr:hypothetical protein [Dysgonomonas alginatilytica]PXV65854.1 major fimbrial subunit protein FimA [Dysgonomonas alginatilytica]
MKKTKFLLAIFAVTTMLFSCSNDKDGENGDDSKPEPMKINLILKGAQTAVRSVDNNPVDEDNVINDLIVFLVRADNTFDTGPFYFPAADIIGGNTVPTINGTTKATSVIIITNTGQFSTGAFDAVTNVASLNAVVSALDRNPNVGSQCISQNVWMSGNANLVANGVDGNGNALRTATVNLGYIPAKIYVRVNNQMTNFDSGNVILDGVSIINGGAWTRFTMNNGDFKPTQAQIPAGEAFFYNGIFINPALYIDQPAAGNFVVNPIYKWAPVTYFPMTSAVTIPAVAAQTATEGFYVFPSITTNKTYVTIFGRYDPNQTRNASNLTEPNYFWSFAFGGSDGLANAIASGEKYVINITLTGNANTGGGGSPDPTEIYDNAYVDITVNSALWTPFIVDKVIQ